MERWEYKTIRHQASKMFSSKYKPDAFNDELMALGAEGWELVSCYTIDMQGMTFAVEAVLKRKVGTNQLGTIEEV